MENQEKSVAVTPEEPQEQSQAGVSRRRLLKTLAVSGGAVAGLTMLPGKWTRPVVEAGELAAHADTSPAPTLRIYDVTFGCRFLDCGGSLCYEDPLGEVTMDAASLDGRLNFECLDPASSIDLSFLNPRLVITAIHGTPSEGCLDYYLKLFGNTDSLRGGFCVGGCIKLVVDGRDSNEVCEQWWPPN